MHTQRLTLPHPWRAALRTASMALALLAVGPVQAQKASASAVSAHEQQLQAIRQALLDATLETTPTQVISSAWVDSQGALHESHEFHSRAEVRGVRVLSYVNDGQEEPRARVSADVLPWSWRQKNPQAGQCETPPRNWRLPMAVAVRMAGGFPGPQQAPAHALLAAAHSDWSDMVQRADRWTTAAWSEPPANSYQRALLSPAVQDNRRWFTTLTLRPAQVPTVWTSPHALWDSPPAWRWHLELQVQQRQAGSQAFQLVDRQVFALSLEPQAMALGPQQALQNLRAEVQQALAEWMARFDAQTRCEPVQFVVQPEGASALRLQAGVGSGLRTGDRVLLMQPGWVPSRMLDPRSVEHLALAEVVQIGPRHTEIRQLAGPPLARQGEWIALPL